MSSFRKTGSDQRFGSCSAAFGSWQFAVNSRVFITLSSSTQPGLRGQSDVGAGQTGGDLLVFNILSSNAQTGRRCQAACGHFVSQNSRGSGKAWLGFVFSWSSVSRGVRGAEGSGRWRKSCHAKLPAYIYLYVYSYAAYATPVYGHNLGAGLRRRTVFVAQRLTSPIAGSGKAGCGRTGGGQEVSRHLLRRSHRTPSQSADRA